MIKSPSLSSLLAAALVAVASANGNEVPIENASFEQGLARWSNWFESPGCLVQPSGSVARSGGSSLHLSNLKAEGKGRMMVFQTVRDIEPDTMYHLSAWAKSDASPRGSVRVGLKLEFYNAEGKNVSGVNGYSSLVKGADWERITAVGRAGRDVATVRIYARLYTEGSVYFDDLQLTTPELVVDEPTRLTHVAGQPVDVRMVIWANSGSAPADVSIEATHEGKTTSYQPAVEPLGENRYALTATLAPIQKGHYELNVKSNGELSERTARTYASHQQRKPAGLSDTGTLLHRGKPFFPIGIYHPRNYAYYKAGGKTNGIETAKESYALIAANGFNAIQGSSTHNLDDLGRDLDLAHEHGLVVDVPLYANGRVAANLPNSLEKVARYKDHPAVLNWKISDEPDIRPEIVNEVPDVYYALKEADPDTPIEVTLATDHTLDSWANFMDIVQIDRYPVPGGELTAVSDFSRLAARSKAPWQNLSYVVQCGWSKDLSNQPTVAQARSMVYLALIEGAKGIWWYSMYDPGWDLTRTPLWPEMKAINEEIRKLSEPLMLGEKVDAVKSSNAGVHCRAVKHDGKLYLLVTNPQDVAQSTTLALADQQVNAEGTTLEGKSVSANEGVVTLELPPLDSRTLIFNYR